MTHEEMIAVIQAHKEGKQIQYRRGENMQWLDCTPQWDFVLFDYRIKPAEPKKVKMFCWLHRGALYWNEEVMKFPSDWIRIPSEDKEIEIPGE